MGRGGGGHEEGCLLGAGYDGAVGLALGFLGAGVLGEGFLEGGCEVQEVGFGEGGEEGFHVVVGEDCEGHFFKGGGLVLFGVCCGSRVRLEYGWMSVWGSLDVLMLGVACCFVDIQSDSDVGGRLVKP